ncbi:MAG: LacI family DNA-binding transcriptional regulator [Abditibacteriota bacterium]|nr:LacI family DNA-binding transcriptional regulator [Abditibacteriota bacterium]MBP5093282.1 LacI family DNA-binding transcriptional regulator [Abditibacteriota bacterium]MBP5738684.1 LacI family DNA-binding transcriptional regulator [Abditibacteriota bacterium]
MSTTTVYDIAKAAGVSRTTVLRALWDKEGISKDTKERIIKLAAEMKYRPNHIARSLVTGQSGFIGVVATPSLFQMSFNTIELIERELSRAGYSMLLASSNGYEQGERTALEKLDSNRVAGVIVIPTSHSTSATAYNELMESGVKLVVVDRFMEGLNATQIVGNDYAVASLATHHLIEQGHTNITYLAISLDAYAGRERLRGFRDAMDQAGIPMRPDSVVETQFGEDFGYKAIERLFERDDPPTAVIARHDVVAAGVIRWLYSHGYKVPDDVSVVGNGDIWCSDLFRVPLTTIRHPINNMARLGLRRLLDMLSGKDVPPRTELVDVEMVVRESTAPPSR